MMAKSIHKRHKAILRPIPISRRKPEPFSSRCSREKALATIRPDICGRASSLPIYSHRGERFSSVDGDGRRKQKMRGAEQKNAVTTLKQTLSNRILCLPHVYNRSSSHVFPDNIPYLYQMPFKILLSAHALVCRHILKTDEVK